MPNQPDDPRGSRREGPPGDPSERATLRGTLLLPTGMVDGSVTFGSHLEAFELGEAVPAPATAEGYAGRAPYILPGFIDVHVHGGGGADTMDGADGVRQLARFHLRHGTTTLLPTTMTNPWDRVMAALDGVAEVARGRPGGGLLPDVPGAHLEGPFISPMRLGAQPPFSAAPSAELVEAVLATGVVRVVTLAPEVEGALEAAERFARAGVRVSVGHTVAGAERVQELVRRVRAAGGTVGFTHLYNAMSQLGSREPGVVGAALADGEAFAELILDLHHVSATSFAAALAAKPGRLMLITDAIRATGGPEGESELGGQRVLFRDGAVRLADGALAGSVLTLDRALRNAVVSGVPLTTAAELLSTVPAAYLGLADRGALEVGRRADLVVLDEDLRVRRVVVGGRELAP